MSKNRLLQPACIKLRAVTMPDTNMAPPCTLLSLAALQHCYDLFYTTNAYTDRRFSTNSSLLSIAIQARTNIKPTASEKLRPSLVGTRVSKAHSIQRTLESLAFWLIRTQGDAKRLVACNTLSIHRIFNQLCTSLDVLFQTYSP